MTSKEQYARLKRAFDTTSGKTKFPDLLVKFPKVRGELQGDKTGSRKAVVAEEGFEPPTQGL